MPVGWVAWILLSSALATDVSVGADCAAELFHIERSTNANVVVYEAHLIAPGTLDREEPVRASWIMLASDGHREELNFFERGLAYGFDVASVPGGFEVRLHARPDRPISVRLRGGCPVALASVAGRELVLRRIFVDVGGGPFPAVKSVELVGLAAEGGAEVRELIPVE